MEWVQTHDPLHRAEATISRSPPRHSCARWPITTSIISSAIRALIFRPSSKPSPGPLRPTPECRNPFLVPHENLAVAMAHGAYLMNGHPQAVMVHVNVGTANTLNNIANASRDRVPLILAAGRTPITEQGPYSARATGRSIGRRKCSTRPVCCARW